MHILMESGGGPCMVLGACAELVWLHDCAWLTAAQYSVATPCLCCWPCCALRMVHKTRAGPGIEVSLHMLISCSHWRLLMTKAMPARRVSSHIVTMVWEREERTLSPCLASLLLCRPCHGRIQPHQRLVICLIAAWLPECAGHRCMVVGLHALLQHFTILMGAGKPRLPPCRRSTFAAGR